MAFGGAKLAFSDHRASPDNSQVCTCRQLFRREAAVIAIALAREERFGVFGGGR
jgi:hypothetical protein